MMMRTNLTKLRVAMVTALSGSGYDPEPGFVTLADETGILIPVLTEESQAVLIRTALNKTGAGTEKTESQKP